MARSEHKHREKVHRRGAEKALNLHSIFWLFSMFALPAVLMAAIVGCAAILSEHKYALNNLRLREYVVKLDPNGKLICTSADVFIDSHGEFTGSNFRYEKGEDCLSKPIVGYSVDDRAKIQAYIEGVASAYYE